MKPTSVLSCLSANRKACHTFKWGGGQFNINRMHSSLPPPKSIDMNYLNWSKGAETVYACESALKASLSD